MRDHLIKSFCTTKTFRLWHLKDSRQLCTLRYVYFMNYAPISLCTLWYSYRPPRLINCHDVLRYLLSTDLLPLPRLSDYLDLFDAAAEEIRSYYITTPEGVHYHPGIVGRCLTNSFIFSNIKLNKQVNL